MSVRHMDWSCGMTEDFYDLDPSEIKSVHHFIMDEKQTRSLDGYYL